MQFVLVLMAVLSFLEGAVKHQTQEILGVDLLMDQLFLEILLVQLGGLLVEHLEVCQVM